MTEAEDISGLIFPTVGEFGVYDVINIVNRIQCDIITDKEVTRG